MTTHPNHYTGTLANFIAGVAAGEPQDDHDIRIAQEAVDALSADVSMYDTVVGIIRDRCEAPGDNQQYEDGMLTMAADLFPLPGMDTDTRMERIRADVWPTLPTIAFRSDGLNGGRTVLRGLVGYMVDLEIPNNSGYPSERVSILRIDDDGDLVVCKTDEFGVPISNSTWAVPVNLIKKVTVL